MKLVRLSNVHKVHVVPLHTNSTLCGERNIASHKVVKEWPGTAPVEVTCSPCAESLEDLRQVQALV